MRRIQQESIVEPQGTVEDVAGATLEEILKDAAQNVRKLAKARNEASGGHDKHLVGLS